MSNYNDLIDEISLICERHKCGFVTTLDALNEIIENIRNNKESVEIQDELTKKWGDNLFKDN